MVNIFKNHQIKQNLIDHYAVMVWEDTDQDNTPKHFDRLDPVPASTDNLKKARNQRRFKHVMLGNKL